jgi:NAD(P)-dependent dehydrogenase (short-subunit alcohol dehydrogenase family)
MDGMKGRVVVVLGGSSGIGFEVARQALNLGARLVIVGRDAAKLAAAADRLPGPVRTMTADLHQDGVPAALLTGLGPFDHLVSMVGDSMVGGFLETDPSTMDHVLHSKFLTNWVIARNAATTIRPGGSLTFTTGAGGRPQDISASYVANQALSAMVQGLASELAPNVRVNAVAPTFMGRGTGFWKGVPTDELATREAALVKTIPLGRIGTVEEVASTYLHLMANGFITGQMVAVDGGIMLRI